MSKRSRFGVVTLLFGEKELRIPSGTRVEDAILLLCKSSACKGSNLILEADANGSILSLPPSFALEENPGWVYRARAEVVVPRRFGAGHAIKDSRECYYVEPKNAETLVADLTMGKYRAICDRRQSGKTTTVHFVERKLQQQGLSAVYVGGLGSANSSWDSCAMWRALCIQIHRACPGLFPAPPKPEECSDETFYSFFYKDNLQCKVILILDEADSLLRLPTACLEELFHTIRDIKTGRDLYNLWAFLLVGVETVKDLLEACYDRSAALSDTPSRLSPFPHDPGNPSVGAFEVEDIVELMEQANLEHDGCIRDIDKIADLIWQLTAGHRGLVGTCLAFLMQQEAFSYREWLELSDSYKLGRHVFGQATYNKMMMYFKTQTQQHYDLLEKFLMADELRYDNLTPLRDLLAEGVLVSQEEGDGYAVKLSSPLLRTAILMRCSIVDQEVGLPPRPSPVDRAWVIREALTTLDVEMLCRPECLLASGAYSEYAHQFMFMCRIKTVLQQAYPFVGAMVLPEVKEVPVEGSKRSRLCLDTLVRDHQQNPRFGYKYLVKGSQEDVSSHYLKSVTYSEQHSAQVYLIHFDMDKDPLEIQPDNGSVYFWAVRFNSAQQTATVRTLDCTGAREEFELKLKKWTGRFNFEVI